MLLTPDELAQLTGKQRRSAQRRALLAMGIEHKVRPDGSLAVLRSHVERLLDSVFSNCYKQEVEPDWGESEVMGVSIYYETPRGKRVDITPGWRSMMWSLLLDNGLTGSLTYTDIESVMRVATEQNRGGEEKPPFDWCLEIAAKMYELIEAIRKYKTVTVIGER